VFVCVEFECVEFVCVGALRVGRARERQGKASLILINMSSLPAVLKAK
jgi:hypothetical protein